MNNAPTARDVWIAGIWSNNAGLVQLLGLCPLLAVTTTLAYGIGLAVATLVVLVASNTLVSATRRFVAPHIRIPVYVLIIAGLVTAVDLAMQAWLFELHRTLGLFVPLIVTNCLIIARAEAFASRQSVSLAILDGLAHGVGFAVVLMVLGALRELLGQGTLFASMDTLFGAAAAGWQIQLHNGLLLFLLPPGAFLALAALVALGRWYTLRIRQAVETPTNPLENV